MHAPCRWAPRSPSFDRLCQGYVAKRRRASGSIDPSAAADTPAAGKDAGAAARARRVAKHPAGVTARLPWRAATQDVPPPGIHAGRRSVMPPDASRRFERPLLPLRTRAGYRRVSRSRPPVGPSRVRSRSARRSCALSGEGFEPRAHGGDLFDSPPLVPEVLRPANSPSARPRRPPASAFWTPPPPPVGAPISARLRRSTVAAERRPSAARARDGRARGCHPPASRKALYGMQAGGTTGGVDNPSPR